MISEKVTRSIRFQASSVVTVEKIQISAYINAPGVD